MSAGSIGIPRGLARDREVSRVRPSPPVIELFIFFEFACQLALLSASIGGARILVRCAAFGVSLLLLMLFPPSRTIHPAVKPAMAVLLIMGLSLFNPHSNTLLSGIMQSALYAAIMAPMLWASNLPLDKVQIRRILLIMLVFQASSSLIGVLQVYYPGHFRGSISTVVTQADRNYMRGLYYKNAAGAFVLRPTGLTDVPGGVGLAGQYAALLGVYFFLTEKKNFIRALAVGSALIGVVAVYLSGIKAAMICLGICLSTFGILFSWSTVKMRAYGMSSWMAHQRISPTAVVTFILVIAIGGYLLAKNIGGEGVTHATQALTQSAPTQVFYRERGQFLEYTLRVLLPEYPLGAGLGRWGMMSHYFGNMLDSNSTPIWVEIQWTGWLVDGGVPLIVAYALALFVAFRFAFRVAINSKLGDLAILGTLVAAYDTGVFAGTFDYVPFIGAMGMDFWLLNAILFGAIAHAYIQANARYARG